MAEKRMFSKTIIDSDLFLDMPVSTQCLYFHLCMRADDDGFVNSPKKILRMVGSSDDDLRLLIAKSFIIPFDSGVVVIKHWRLHNYIRKDTYTPTIYQEEKDQLQLDENKSYTVGQPSVDVSSTQYRLDKSRLDQIRLEESSNTPAPEKKKPEKHKYGEYKHVLLTDDELAKLQTEHGYEETEAAIKYLDEYTEMKGYKCKSHYLAIKKWVFDAVAEKRKRRPANNGMPETDNPFARILQEMDDE